jgi:antitoxin (DNA-binding transcriptional repressor) of toxin-antitoxin stability system
MPSNIIPAGQFKTHCLQIMETVRKTGKTITITKRNIPIAQIGPIEKNQKQSFGKLKGTVHVETDIISPIDENWYADS